MLNGYQRILNNMSKDNKIKEYCELVGKLYRAQLTESECKRLNHLAGTLESKRLAEEHRKRYMQGGLFNNKGV